MSKKVRVLVTGSRSWDKVEYLEEVFKRWDAELGAGVRKILVSGECPQGADKLAEDAVERLGWEIESYPADWDRHGKRAGFVRNSEMVETSPDYTIAFIHNESRGAGMTERMSKKAGIPTETHALNDGIDGVVVSKKNFPEVKTWDTTTELW